MKKKHEIGEIVCSYLERFPNEYSRTIARAIYKKYPKLGTIESIRSRIRYYRSSNGKYARMTLNDTRFVDYDIPESDMEIREDFILPKDANDILLLYDVHACYHDTRAIDAMLDWCIDKKINTIVIGGDFLDFYKGSSFMQDIRKRDLWEEIEIGQKLLKYIKEGVNPRKIFYLMGNHEARWDRYLKVNAPQLIKFPQFRISQLLNMPGVEFIEHGRLIRAGNYFIGHGDEFGGRSSNLISPARTFSLRAKANFIGGHFHKTGTEPIEGLTDEIMFCHSVGCLCGLYPEFMRYNRWNHGFARLVIDDNGIGKVSNIRIYKGVVAE
ncbi:MAG: metallophosphoesterase [Bacteroidales bacterium]|jgi:hypothetical protein|nr:metallophosphoesterase [Bacteroidales bacterium]